MCLSLPVFRDPEARDRVPRLDHQTWPAVRGVHRRRAGGSGLGTAGPGRTHLTRPDVDEHARRPVRHPTDRRDPTALTVSPLLTAPLIAEHPMVRFSLESMSSMEIVTRLNDFDIDVGMTYVDGEPLGKARVVALYPERYLFLTPHDGEYAQNDSIDWAEAASAPLCLLVPVMQKPADPRRLLRRGRHRRRARWWRPTPSRRSMPTSLRHDCPASFPIPGCTGSAYPRGHVWSHCHGRAGHSTSAWCWPAEGPNHSSHRRSSRPHARSTFAPSSMARPEGIDSQRL